jgi:hypothetical protein
MSKKTKLELTQTQLKEILDYNPDTGILTWLKTDGRCIKDKIAGHKNYAGYILIGINGYIYFAHRLAFLYMTGMWPEKFVDHINQIKDDNSWINLRNASKSNNMCNQRKYKNNKSNFKGVSYCKETNKWRATIRINNKQIDLGRYTTPEEASVAYEQKAKELHKEFYYKNNI